ncbi:hypothetical protein DDE01_04050 [Desulfovibrio desulfuricans]|nr:hypothetical protein DDE01_04050 [Desulfovibrio desulfuricans]
MEEVAQTASEFFRGDRLVALVDGLAYTQQDEVVEAEPHPVPALKWVGDKVGIGDVIIVKGIACLRRIGCRVSGGVCTGADAHEAGTENDRSQQAYTSEGAARTPLGFAQGGLHGLP